MEQQKNTPNTLTKHKQKNIGTPQTDKTLYQSRCAHDITEFNPPPLCSTHSQEIGHMCFTCDAKCLCPYCFNSGQHRNHQVKNLQRSHLVVQASLNEYLIRIKSKSELLSLLHENISSFQNQITEQFEIYKDHIQASFDRAVRVLIEKKQNILDQICQMHEQNLKKSNWIMNQVRHCIKDSMGIYRLVEKKIKQLPNYLLCFFYSDKKRQIQQLASQQIINYFKQSLPPVKWNINTTVFKQLQAKVEQIDFMNTYAFQDDLSDKKDGSNKISKKKLRKISKLPCFQKSRKPRQSHPVSPINHKESSKQRNAKELCKRVKSPGFQFSKIKRKASGKMVSMPASPIKDNKQGPPVIFMDFHKKQSRKKL